MNVFECARNNARWCDAVCRSHGVTGRFGAEAWTSARRTPPLYPDAVTLVEGADAHGLLDSIDTASPGASVKDSFADLDLGAAGFTVLFAAWWISCEPGVPRSSSWVDIDDRTLGEWEHAWVAAGGVLRVVLPALLRERGVRVLADIRDGRVVAGAIANHTDSVVGLTNLFPMTEDAWNGCRDAIIERFPDTTIVGYETEDALPVAQLSGFEPVAPLRIWIDESS